MAQAPVPVAAERHAADWQPATRVLAAGLLANAVAWIALFLVVVASGEAPRAAVTAIPPGLAADLTRPAGLSDSWDPMVRAFHDRRPAGPGIYSAFFDEGVKFQYPPMALLPLRLVPERYMTLRPANTALGFSVPPGFSNVAGWLSLGAFWLSVLATWAIAERAFRQWNLSSPGSRQSSLRLVLVLALGATFHPLVSGHPLGQIQVFLNAAIAVAIWLHLTGRPALAGCCVGLCCLFKPQYALVLVWALAARQKRLAAGLVAVTAAGGVLSLMAFGWQPHVEYINVLREIGRSGESFWANQSLNGVLNRFSYNGDPDTWDPRGYAPFVPWIYGATIAGSITLVAVAAFALRRPLSGAHSTLDLTLSILVATMASPVAWTHHYGVLFPILAVAVPALLANRPAGRITPLVLLAVVVLVSNVLVRPQLFFANRVQGLAASHVFFGALLLFGLLVLARLRPGVSSSRTYA